MRGRPQLYATSAITLAAYTTLAYVLSSATPTEYPPLLTRSVAQLFPHIIALVNGTTLVMLYLGYSSIKRGDVAAHRSFMLASFGLIAAFLVLYISKLLVLGTQEYEGPQLLRLYLYLPMLFIHLGLSVVSVPLVLYNVITGLTMDKAQVRETMHPRSGRLAYKLWTLSLVLGIVVYLFLRYLQ